MVSVDLVVSGGTVVTDLGTVPADITVRDGRIVALTAHGEARHGAAEMIDARGLHVFPGGIDPHVHFGDQGQSDFEDFESGTRAAAAGGVTTVLDMPLNLPPTVDAATFAARRDAVAPRAVVDFGLWGGLIPGNLDQLAPMAELGAVAFKAFTCEAADWYRIEDGDLLEGMREAARLGIPVGVHCENDAIIRGSRARLRAAGRRDLRAHHESRPEVAEWEAIARVALLARVGGARTQVVHISTGEGVESVWQARRAGAEVFAEVTAHHLTLDEEDGVRLGTHAKCAPPLRSRGQVDALWRHVLGGRVHNIGSDHSPATEEQKNLAGREHWDVPDGITGVQTIFSILLSEGVHRRGLSLPACAGLIATHAARTFGIYPRKGAILVGSDADLAILDLDAQWTLRREDLLYKCPWSPHVGRQFTGRIVRTVLRGRTVFRDGEVLAPPGTGAFLGAGSPESIAARR